MEKILSFDQLPIAVNQLSEKLTNIERLLQEQQTAEEPDKLLTIRQAAEFLSLSVPTIYGKVSKRELPFMKRGKRLYFSRSELMDYLKQGRRKTNHEIEEDVEKNLSAKRGLK